MKRALSPSTNATGISAAAAAIYAAVIMVWHVAHHEGVFDPGVIIAAIGAAAFLYARFKVTPLADPKDANGNPLHGPLAAGDPPEPGAPQERIQR